MDNNDIYREYSRRFRMLRSKRAVSQTALKKALENAFSEREVSDNILRNWAGGYRNIPPIGALCVIAFTLDTSCSYLVGQHDIESFSIRKNRIDTSIEQIKAVYKDVKGVSMHNPGSHIAPNWINGRKKNGVDPLDRTLPYLKLADDIGVWLDYILGLSDIRGLTEYAFYSENYETLPGGTLLVIRNDAEGRDEYGIVMEGGDKVVMQTGEVLDTDLFKKRGAVPVRAVKT